jgi:hypothetical protein
MRGRARIAAACVAVGLAAGSVGAVELHGSKAKPAKPRLTRQQLGAKKLLAEYAQHPDCGCTGATRARDRVQSGKVKQVQAAESAGSAATP